MISSNQPVRHHVYREVKTDEEATYLGLYSGSKKTRLKLSELDKTNKFAIGLIDASEVDSRGKSETEGQYIKWVYVKTGNETCVKAEISSIARRFNITPEKVVMLAGEYDINGWSKLDNEIQNEIVEFEKQERKLELIGDFTILNKNAEDKEFNLLNSIIKIMDIFNLILGNLGLKDMSPLFRVSKSYKPFVYFAIALKNNENKMKVKEKKYLEILGDQFKKLQEEKIISKSLSSSGVKRLELSSLTNEVLNNLSDLTTEQLFNVFINPKSNKIAPEIVKFLMLRANSTLILAVKKGRLDVIKKLSELGADLNTRDLNGNTLLHLAISSESSLEMVNFLLEKHVPINNVNRWKETALYLSVRKGNKDIIETLLNNNAEVNTVNNDKNLLCAVFQSAKPEWEVIKLLLEKGATIDLVSLKRNLPPENSRDNDLIIRIERWQERQFKSVL